MINLDMVGRLREDQLIALGSDTAPQWKDPIARAATGAGLHVTSKGDGYGPSDQTSFYAAGVPVLHLFTGAHGQYKPATVNPEGAAKVVAFAISLGQDLSTAMPRPVRACFRRAHHGRRQPRIRRLLGNDLGLQRDGIERRRRAARRRLSARTADLAGIRGKDRIVEMAGTRVENLYDMTYVLQEHRPAETIDVVVIRDGRRARCVRLSPSAAFRVPREPDRRARGASLRRPWGRTCMRALRRPVPRSRRADRSSMPWKPSVT